MLTELKILTTFTTLFIFIITTLSFIIGGLTSHKELKGDR
jgi:hypothetical protein